MEYSRDRGSIQADFALRAGRLHAQYCDLVDRHGLSEGQRYDATLAVCVLQALLTNCTELLKAIREKNKRIFLTPLSEEHSDWLPSDAVQRHDYEPMCTLACALEHLRNALSHPTTARTAGDFPLTGYTTTPDGSGRVQSFRFVDSPWVSRGNLLAQYSHRDPDKVRAAAAAFERRQKWPEGTFTIQRLERDKFGVLRDGNRFLPVCVINLSLGAMHQLIGSLSTWLAQATDERWDWHTIKPLVA